MRQLFTTSLIAIVVLGSLFATPLVRSKQTVNSMTDNELVREFPTASPRKTVKAPASLTQYKISGSVIDKISAAFYPGFTVKALTPDAAHTVLGVALTDPQGRYEISLDNLHAPVSVAIDVSNREGDHVRSIARLLLNAEGVTQVDFFLFRKEAIPNDFCCFSSNSLGECPARLLSRHAANRLINQLKLSGLKFWRLRQRAFETLLRSVEPGDDCGESRKTQLLALLRARGESKLFRQLSDSCLSPDLPVKTFNTERFEIQYVEDQTFEPIAVNPERPTANVELKLPDKTSLGYLRADLDVPTYVQQIGLIAEHSLGRFLNPPLSLKDPRGDKLKGLIPMSICFLEDYAGATSVRQSYVEINSKNSLVKHFGTV